MTIFEVWTMKLPYRRWMVEEVTSKYYHDFFKELAGKNILEVGCGHGFGVRAIKRYFSPKKIVATDVDPRMIASARKNIDDSEVVFEEADATKLHYKDNSFDAIFVYGVIHHIPGPLWKNCLKELYRVISPGGKVFIYDNSIESFRTFWGRINKIISVHPYDSMYRKTEFFDYLKRVGFTILKDIDLGRYFVVVAEKQG